ncbi:MAG TPA: dienelactone hydrolase family protein [Alphaproteobacteria bacterium]|nr:dienelactone hydrolase family protein [Alphaproteobacteria bacterium]
MDQRLIDLYDEYTHAPLERRVFLDRLAKLAGGTAAAAAVLPLLEGGYAHAQTVPADDPRIRTERVEYPGRGGAVKGLLAWPANPAGRLPAVVVIHENRGLNPHIEDVARRFAVAGHLALAPDLLSPLGGTPADADAARAAIGKLDREQTLGNLDAALAYLAGHQAGNGKVGSVGFCWGGGMSGALATRNPDLDAAVVYYGQAPEAAAVPAIRAPLLLHYAGLDARINEGVPAFEAALKAAGKPYELHMYEGANHAFNNDTSAERYNAEAAKLAWDRTLAFFGRHLKA